MIQGQNRQSGSTRHRLAKSSRGRLALSTPATRSSGAIRARFPTRCPLHLGSRPNPVDVWQGADQLPRLGVVHDRHRLSSTGVVLILHGLWPYGGAGNARFGDKVEGRIGEAFRGQSAYHLLLDCHGTTRPPSGSDAVGYSPRPKAPHRLDSDKAIINARLEAYSKLTTQRLFGEARAAGYVGGYNRLSE